MSRRRWTAALLLFILLSGCTEPGAPASSDSSYELPIPTQTRSEAPVPESGEALTEPTATTDAPESRSDPTTPARPEPIRTEPGESAPDRTEPFTPEPAVTESTSEEPMEARPRVLSMGLYDGPYPEDGSGEPVESIAVILVENDSDTQLQFAELHYRIDERDALFRVSELPPGEKTLAVEYHRLVATPASVWKAAPEADLLVYLAAEPPEGLEFRCEQAGRLSIKNVSGKAAGFDLIYKQRGKDGIFTGGIAYHVAVPVLQAGERAVLEAPHFTEDAVIVRVTAKTP